jgi:hypothetical protein
MTAWTGGGSEMRINGGIEIEDDHAGLQVELKWVCAVCEKVRIRLAEEGQPTGRDESDCDHNTWFVQRVRVGMD